MTKYMSPRTKAVFFACLGLTTLVLAGCGNHGQAGGGSGTMTRQQVEQNAQKQNQPQNAPATAGAPATPVAPATH